MDSRLRRGLPLIVLTLASRFPNTFWLARSGGFRESGHGDAKAAGDRDQRAPGRVGVPSLYRTQMRSRDACVPRHLFLRPSVTTANAAHGSAELCLWIWGTTHYRGALDHSKEVKLSTKRSPSGHAP